MTLSSGVEEIQSKPQKGDQFTFKNDFVWVDEYQNINQVPKKRKYVKKENTQLKKMKISYLIN